MASGLLKSRHVKMRGSSVMFDRRAQLVSAVAVGSGWTGTAYASDPGWCVSASLMQQQGTSGLEMSGVATVRRVETHEETSAGRVERTRNCGWRRWQRRNVFRRFLGEPTSVLEQWSGSRGWAWGSDGTTVQDGSSSLSSDSPCQDADE